MTQTLTGLNLILRVSYRPKSTLCLEAWRYVSSKYGPVSYVNAVDGFKIPGVSKNGNQISINFDLGINSDFTNLPTTGTFYKFIPEVNGKMKFKFDAKSMNYYRWDLPGNATYNNTEYPTAWQY